MSTVVYWSDKSWLIGSVMSWWHEQSIKYTGSQLWCGIAEVLPIGFVVLFNALITLRSYWYNDFKSNWPVISYPSPLIPAVFSFGLGSGFAPLYSLLYEGTRNPAPRKFFCWSFSTRGAWPEGCTIPLQERPLLSSDVRHVLYVFRAVATYARSWSLRLSVNLYTAISRKVIGKSARDNPERYCGWFVLSSLVLQWYLKKWHERGHGRIFASAKEK